MFKKLILHGALSGLLAGIASIIYARVYNASLGSDFSLVIQSWMILITCIVICLLASLAYWLLNKWLKTKGEIVFNFAFTILTIACILPVFAVKLPFDIEAPELFPGFAIPMLFFPALGWFTLKPLFSSR